MTPEGKISSEILGCVCFWIFRMREMPINRFPPVLAENAIWLNTLHSPSAADQKSLGISSMKEESVLIGLLSIEGQVLSVLSPEN